MYAFKKAEIPLLLLLLPFITGLGFAVTFPGTVYIFWFQFIFYVLLAVFVVLNIAYRKVNIYKVKWVGGVLMNLLLLFAGIICLESHRESNSNDHFSKIKSDYLLVSVTNEPKLNSGILRFTAIVKQAESKTTVHRVSGNLMVSVRVDSASRQAYAYGDELLIPTNYTAVEGPMNPAEFNYKAYLAHQNIYQQSFLVQKQVAIVKHDQGNMLVANALNIRKQLVGKLAVNIRDSDALAVASTIILGYRADLRKDVQEAYSKTGTMHLLSVSGMHVGLVYLMVSFLLAFLPPKRNSRIIKAIITIATIWCYALITGFSPAVCRASLMLSMFIVGFAFNRHINKLNLLAESAFVLLLSNPFLITDAGFQLSYLAVFGIIILQPIIYKWLDIKIWLLRKIWMVCSVSIAAQVILFPVSAFYFHDLPVYFLASNVFIIIPSMIVMFGGIVYLILPNIPVVTPCLGWLLQKTIVAMTATLTAMERAPLGSINKIWLNGLEFLLFYALLVSVIYAIGTRSKVALKLCLLFVMLIATSISVKRFNAMTTDNITFLSLHRNTGVLFRDGDRALLLTDLKPKDKNYQYSVQPYLDSCKISALQSVGVKGDTSMSYIGKQQNFIRFKSTSLLVFDKSVAKKTLAQKLNLDYIYITGSPDVDVAGLLRNYKFKMLIADGSNSNNLINKLETEAKTLKVNFRSLKRNNSVIIASNQ